jgi:hypothetical protein
MMQNPPLELSLDGSTGASDDHEVEEGGDGVWSVVGGKVVFSLSLGTHLLLIYGLIATVIIRIVANVENLDCRTLGSYSFFL